MAKLNHSRMASIVGISLWSFFAAGCATCSTDPDNLSRVCAATHQLGMNSQLDSHLAERQTRADALDREAERMRSIVETSLERVSRAELKLQAVDRLTESSRNEARKLRIELSLKKEDLESKERELNELTKRVADLKESKRDKKSALVETSVLEAEMEQTVKEIDVLRAYLHEDLLIRAENSIKYD